MGITRDLADKVATGEFGGTSEPAIVSSGGSAFADLKFNLSSEYNIDDAIELRNSKIALLRSPVMGTNQVPAMTSNTSPSGTASASVIYSATYDAWKAFNGTASSGTDAWVGSSTGFPQWIQYEPATPFAIGKLIITNRNNTDSGSSAPDDFSLLASNDGVNWDELGRWQISSWAPAAVKEFIPEINESTYSMFRIHVYGNIIGDNGATAIGNIQLIDLAGISHESAGLAITNDESSFNLTFVSKINALNIKYSQPVNTNIKGLVSFDGRTTWEYYNGASWEISDIANIETNGMSITNLIQYLKNYTVTSEEYLDFAFSLTTTDASVTPEINEITIQYGEPSSAAPTSAIERIKFDNADNYELSNCIISSGKLKANESSEIGVKLLIEGGDILQDLTIGNKTINIEGSVDYNNSSNPFTDPWKTIYCPSGAYLHIDDSDDFEFGTNSFTVDMWVYIPTLTSGGHIIMKGVNGAWANVSWRLHIDSNKLKFSAGNSGGSQALALISTDDLTTNTWTHIAIARDGNSWYLFIDGQIQATATSSISLLNTAHSLYVASDGAGATYGGFLEAGFSSIRITKGSARWTEAFNVSDAPPSKDYNSKASASTSNESNLDLSFIESINNIKFTYNQPANSFIRALASFDERQTWKKWNSGNQTWDTVNYDIMALVTRTGTNRTTSVSVGQQLLTAEAGTQRIDLDDPSDPITLGGAGSWWSFSGSSNHIDGDGWATSTPGNYVRFNISGTDILRIYGTRDNAANAGGTYDVIINGVKQGSYTLPVYSTLTKGLVVYQILDLDPNKEHSVEIVVTACLGTTAQFEGFDIDENGSVTAYTEPVMTSGIENGNTLAELEGALQSYQIGPEDVYLDFAFGLLKTDISDSPEIDAITIQYVTSEVSRFESVDVLPEWTTKDIGRVLYQRNIKKVNFGTEDGWKQLVTMEGGNYPTDGLVAEWTFDKTEGNLVIDPINNYNGTLGSTTVIGAGLNGNCGVFDGAPTSSIQVPFFIPRTALANGKFTISCWIYPQDDLSTTRQFLYSFDNTYRFYFQTNSYGIGWGLGNTYNLTTNTDMPTIDSWNHILIYYDLENINIRVNMGDEFSYARSSTLFSNVALGIGGDDSGTSNHNGKIDQIRIYNRVLSLNEMSLLYNSGTGI